MTEQQIKLLCKVAIERINKPFTKMEKELFKYAIDNARNREELFLIVITYMSIK